MLHTTSEWRPALAQSTRRFPLPGRAADLLSSPSPHHLHRAGQTEQVRFRRHDRASAFAKPRPKTKRQRQTYNRRMKKQTEEAAKHGPPGSKAGPRRQWARDRWQQLLEHGTQQTDGQTAALLDPEATERYTLEDALLEDVIGNTAHLTSQPTPVPVYLGHRHRDFYNRVADQMDKYREAIDEAGSDATLAPSSSSSSLSTAPSADLPSDKDISNVVRAYRDRHGTRQKPIGIVMALQHLLQDLGVPTVAFGEYTYSALLTCCRTPPEARRIFKLMTESNHAISPYSWSILADVHAKIGDFAGCSRVLDEMTSRGGHAPTQAAYTSLLAACHRVCNDGRVPHAVRAEAGNVGWTHWQRMRIVGIEPDAMAYGAIIRLCAARGQPERAIGLLEDMQRFDVKPTTLCFSGALRAVAKSHEIAVRFENGSSTKQLKRESTAAHHGNLARRIVIMAEAAEVEQDDGFVSALMLCAAAAGDSATAKAIFLAAEIRRMDHLRTIGSGDPFQVAGYGLETDAKMLEAPRGRSNDTPGLVVAGTSDSPPSNVAHRNGQLQTVKPFGEREYGKDTRTLSALMRASAQAMNRNGIGTMWAGRENLGFLCENSLRLITTRWEPSYRDTSIPGLSSTKVGIGALRRMDENDRDEEPKPGKRKKFRGLYIDEDATTTTDDLDDDDLFVSECVNNVDFDEEDETEFPVNLPEPVSRNGPMPVEDKEKVSPSCLNLRRESHLYCTLPDWSFLREHVSCFGSTGGKINSTCCFVFAGLPPDHDALTSAYICLNIHCQRFVPKLFQELQANVDLSESDLFETFLAELKMEAARNGEEFDLSESETRELFELVQEEFSEVLEGGSGDGDSSHATEFDEAARYEQFLAALQNEANTTGEEFDLNEAEVEELFQMIKDDVRDDDEAEIKLSVADGLNKDDGTGNSDGRSLTVSSTEDPKSSSYLIRDHVDRTIHSSEPLEADAAFNLEDDASDLSVASAVDLTSEGYNLPTKLEELQAALPGMPLGRLKKIVKAFEGTLGSPSMLTLIPILRETMPDYVTSGWLKRTNRRNAEFVLRKASEEGLIDPSLLNAMLEVRANAGSIDDTLEFHATEFHKHNLVSAVDAFVSWAASLTTPPFAQISPTPSRPKRLGTVSNFI